MTPLVPLPVAVPITVAAFLLASGHFLPRRVPDLLAMATALAMTVISAVMATRSVSGPLTYWFGGWSTIGAQVVGIRFQVDPFGAALAAFAGLLFFATFIFAWGVFEKIGALFHVLMLFFLAAIDGFVLTHDLFNLFVWFEVMSVAAFSLTAYRLEASALEGAMNFTVTNSLASFCVLGGIGLIYLRVGALDFSALSQAVAADGGDPLFLGSFALLATGFLIKGAMVPFQAWLSDTHAVAPSPVSVIFSGIMVPVGLFGVVRLYFSVFAGSGVITTVLNTLGLWIGVASALLGGFMCLTQRHLKRLLAFSTISHVGVMLAAFAILSAPAQAGFLLYLLGHGLTKGALFMLSGLLLATLGGIDEIGLRGLGRQVWPAGIAFAVGGLLLGGAPVGLMDEGTRLIDAAASQAHRDWAALACLLASALTGGAVLRATGRIFLGWGKVAGEEERGPSEQEQEDANRPLWLLLLPAVVLLCLALAEGGTIQRYARLAVVALMSPGQAAHAPVPVPKPPHPILPWISTLLALLIAAFDLFRDRIPHSILVTNDRITTPLRHLLEPMHSGRVGDYVAWIVAGLAMLAIALSVAS